MEITIGRVVQYKLSAEDAQQIMWRRMNRESIDKRMNGGLWPEGAQARIGNPVEEAQYVPMMVTAVNKVVGFPYSITVNGQCFLDGCDVYWMHLAREGIEEGTWRWPPRA